MFCIYVTSLTGVSLELHFFLCTSFLLTAPEITRIQKKKLRIILFKRESFITYISSLLKVMWIQQNTLGILFGSQTIANFASSFLMECLLLYMHVNENTVRPNLFSHILKTLPRLSGNHRSSQFTISN